MSTDLSRALVPSMGHHDPLDGLVRCLELRARAISLGASPHDLDLDEALAYFGALLEGESLATADLLGLGGLLIDAGLVAQLAGQGAVADGDLLEALLAATLAGLSHGQWQRDLDQPAERRLAFRELGLAIGLAGLPLIDAQVPVGGRVRERLDVLRPFEALGASIASFWRDPSHRRNPVWSEHRDINDVMLASALAPNGVLVLHEARA